MNNLIIEFEKVKDSKGKIRTNLISENIITEIKKVYKNWEILTRKELIVSFYKGYIEVPKCKNDNCSNFVKWKSNTLSFGQYCCPKCSNSDPKKDEITVKNNIEKYGVPRASMTEISKAKLLKTNLERFGCVSSAQHQSVKDKALKTNLEKYSHVSTEVGNITNLEHYNDKNFIINNFINNNMFLKDEFINYFGCGQVAAHNTLTRLGIEYKKYSSLKETSIERKIKEFLIENYIKFETKYRDKYELDFYLPDYNIGIELDGLYFHSYGGIPNTIEYYQNKHSSKFQYFLSKKITVISIWENEVMNTSKFNNWKYHLLNILGYDLVDLLKLEQLEFNKSENSLEFINFLFDHTIEPIIDYEYVFKIQYLNNLVGLITFNLVDYQINICNICIDKKYINEVLKIEILKYMCKSYKTNIIFPVYFRHGNIRYYEDMLPFEYIKNNHLIFRPGKLKDITLSKVDSKEVYSSNWNYCMVWDESLELAENLNLNNYLSLWDSGSFLFKIKYLEK